MVHDDDDDGNFFLPKIEIARKEASPAGWEGGIMD